VRLISHTLGGAALVVLVLGLAACGDQPGRAPTQPPGLEVLTATSGVPSRCNTDRVNTLIEAIWGPTLASREVKGKWTQAQQYVKNNDYPSAQAIIIDIADRAVTDFNTNFLYPTETVLNGETLGQAISEMFSAPAPTGPPWPATSADYTYNMFPCANLVPPNDISNAFTAPQSTELGAARVFRAGEAGTLKARNGQVAIRFPASAITESKLVTMVVVPQATLKAANSTCLYNAGLTEYGNCFETRANGTVQGLVGPISYALCSMVSDASAVHARLRLASRSNPTGEVRVFPRDDISDLVSESDCTNAVLAAGPEPGLIDRLAERWPAVGHLALAARRAGELFAVNTAWAWDGVGTTGGKLGSRFVAVDPIVQATASAESDNGSFPAWDGCTTQPCGLSWQALPQGNTWVNTAHSKYVVEPNNDPRLPSSGFGLTAWWFGTATNGNYVGTLASPQGGKSGGTSVAPTSGVLSSPAFLIPATTSALTFAYSYWFDIESVRPSTADQMTVDLVFTDGKQPASVRLNLLNPPVDPTVPTPDKRAPLAFTSALPAYTSLNINQGVNVAPSWQKVSTDQLSCYKGRTAKLQFSFATGDVSFNGFRGLVIDDVTLRVGAWTATNSTGGATCPASPAP